MNKLFVAVLLLVITRTEAQEFRLSCVTPTTAIYMWAEKDYLIARIHHPYGIRFTPFYKGQISLIQMSNLNRLAEIQAGLGDYQETQWPIEKCKIRAPFLISCSEGKLTSSEDNIRPFSLETSLITTETPSNTYRSLNFRLGLLVNNEQHGLTSDYSPEMHCR